MNNSEKFIAFLESLKTSSNASLIDAVKNGFELTEANVRGMNFPDVAPTSRRNVSTKQLSAEEQAANTARFKREGAKSRQGAGLAKSAVAQLAKYAKIAPMDVEAWINEVIKPAIKEGKVDLDTKFGTNSAKTGVVQRLKNAGKAILGEGVEDEYEEVVVNDVDDFDDADFDDEDELGGFQSNKFMKREANMRRESAKN